MLALTAVEAAVCDIAHLFRVATRQHLRHRALVVGRLVARMGVGKRVPVLSKDLLEDTPVPRGCCNHRAALSWGDTIVIVQRLYHGLTASSTPHRPVYHHPPLLPSSLSYGDFWAEKMQFPIRSRKNHRTQPNTPARSARR